MAMVGAGDSFNPSGFASEDILPLTPESWNLEDAVDPCDTFLDPSIFDSHAFCNHDFNNCGDINLWERWNTTEIGNYPEPTPQALHHNPPPFQFGQTEVQPHLPLNAPNNQEEPPTTNPRKRTAGVRTKRPPKVIERRYRSKLKACIKDLEAAVPTLRSTRDIDAQHPERQRLSEGLEPTHKRNKATIIAKAIEYIHHLEEHCGAASLPSPEDSETDTER